MRRNRSWWEARVAEFEESGESHAAFCDRNRLHLPTFRGWLYRIRRSTERAIEPAPMRLVQLSSSECMRGFELEIGPRSVVVRSDSPVDVAYVAQLARALRGSS